MPIPYLNIIVVTAPREMVGLERMLDYRGVGLHRFHCTALPIQHSGTSLIRHSMGPENNVGLGGCQITE